MLSDSNTMHGRLINKHHTSTEWDKTPHFIPQDGELILYTDLNSLKIGDGIHSVGILPFLSTADLINYYTKDETDELLQDKADNQDVFEINDKIPPQASYSNQLADKQFVRTGLDEKVDKSNLGIANGVATLDSNGKVDPDQLNPIEESVLSYIELVYDGNSVTLQKHYVYLADGSRTEQTELVKLADSNNAGLMPKETVTTIASLLNRVDSLEGRTVRLLYTDGPSPTESDIEAFVELKGYSYPFSGVAVVIADTYHIWHYYVDEGWKDDGTDTVTQFTNNQPGVIRGSNTAGKVYAEDDGTGSVVGFDAVKSHTENSSIHVTETDKSSWNSKQNALTFDNTPTVNSNNPVTSGGIHTALLQKSNKIQIVQESGVVSQIQLDDHVELRLQRPVSDISIADITESSDDFISVLVFKTSSIVSGIDYSSEYVCIGDDVYQGQFVPQPGTTYKLTFMNDGFNYVMSVTSYIKREVI